MMQRSTCDEVVGLNRAIGNVSLSSNRQRRASHHHPVARVCQDQRASTNPSTVSPKSKRHGNRTSRRSKTRANMMIQQQQQQQQQHQQASCSSDDDVDGHREVFQPPMDRGDDDDDYVGEDHRRHDANVHARRRSRRSVSKRHARQHQDASTMSSTQDDLDASSSTSTTHGMRYQDASRTSMTEDESMDHHVMDDREDDMRRDDGYLDLIDHAQWLKQPLQHEDPMFQWMSMLDHDTNVNTSSRLSHHDLHDTHRHSWMIAEAHIDHIQHESITDETCPSCKTIMCVNTDGYQVSCHQCQYRSTICDNIVSNVPFNDEVDFSNISTPSNYTSMHQNTTPDILAYALNIRSKILGRMTKPCPYADNEALVQCIILCIQQSLHKFDTASITIDDVYACCKAHKWKELYPWITYLFCKITSRALPTLTHLEDEICTAKYRLVRDVYYRTCKPDDRVNFMDYKHVWYKIWEHMGATHLLPFVRLLDAAKLRLQDGIWQRICDHLGWTFVPTEPRKKTVIQPLDQKRLDMCRM